MKFIDVKDENGTTLQSYAELLAEKAKALGFVTVIVFASQERKMLHTFTTMDGSVPNALIKLGQSMLSQQEPQDTSELVAKPN